MPECVLCRFAVELDDVEILMPSGRRCICVRCWHREVDHDARAVTARVRREVDQGVEPVGDTP